MSSAPASRTYARALMEAAGSDAARVADELDAFAAVATEAPTEWEALVGPGIPIAARKGTIDRPQFQDTPFWTVDTLFYTEILSAADPRYLYYLFLTIDWKSMNEASGVPSLSSRRIESVHVMLPPLGEQRAISEVLSDTDVDLEATKARLVKAKALKQGMMQQLLTGQTRLSAEVTS